MVAVIALVPALIISGYCYYMYKKRHTAEKGLSTTTKINPAYGELPADFKSEVSPGTTPHPS